eukprot:892619-Ditylum_brightwellii.AAC.1
MKQLETKIDNIQAKSNGRTDDLNEKISIKNLSSQPIDNVTVLKLQKDITEVNNATIKVADSLNDCLEKLENGTNRKPQYLDVLK